MKTWCNRIVSRILAQFSWKMCLKSIPLAKWMWHYHRLMCCVTHFTRSEVAKFGILCEECSSVRTPNVSTPKIILLIHKTSRRQVKDWHIKSKHFHPNKSEIVTKSDREISFELEPFKQNFITFLKSILTNCSSVMILISSSIWFAFLGVDFSIQKYEILANLQKWLAVQCAKIISPQKLFQGHIWAALRLLSDTCLNNFFIFMSSTTYSRPTLSFRISWTHISAAQIIYLMHIWCYKSVRISNPLILLANFVNHQSTSAQSRKLLWTMKTKSNILVTNNNSKPEK